MKRNTIILIVCLVVVMIVLALNYYFEPFLEIVSNENKQELQEQMEPTPEISAVDTIFNRFDEKDAVGHLLAWPVIISDDGSIDDNDLTEEVYLEVLSKKKPGFFTLFGSQIASTSAQTTVQKLRNYNGSVLPAWIAVDHEGGTVQRLNGEGYTQLASWSSVCDLDTQQVDALVRKSALELQNTGIDVVLAPVVDVGPISGGLKNRICSANPDLVVRNANTYINAFKNQGIMPVIKHFPGIGEINVDLHDQFAVGRVGVNDVFVYRSLLTLHPSIGVMTTHIGLDNQFADIPCSLSADCVGELTTNYDQVLVFSDALEMKSALYLPESTGSAQQEELSLAEASKKAIIAGNDVLLYGPSVNFEQLSEVYDMLVREYLADAEFRKNVDQRVKKIIAHKLGVPVENEVQYPEIKQN